jgi:hypothetical protein
MYKNTRIRIYVLHLLATAYGCETWIRKLNDN